MNNIEVSVIAEHGGASEMMCFLARLTQRGSDITSMEDLRKLMDKPASDKLAASMIKMEHHGTIKRFTPITIAIVGASRRFLAQARTNQVGFNYVSASLQYSDYSGKGQFVVPYALMEHDRRLGDNSYTEEYLRNCEDAMNAYKFFAEQTDNDTAGYVAPQGLRNILIMQGNHEAWSHFITTRTCSRNTPETQYVALRIWEELLKTDGGNVMFANCGPDCRFGKCLEGKMCCGEPMKDNGSADLVPYPTRIIERKWPLLN